MGIRHAKTLAPRAIILTISRQMTPHGDSPGAINPCGKTVLTSYGRTTITA